MDELLKIPDSVLLKESRKEVGQLNAEITHLVHELMEAKKEIELLKKEKNTMLDLSKAEARKIKSGQMYQDIKKQNKALRNLNRQLRTDKTNLISQIVKLQKK